jgi:hypothetical protein
VVIAKTNPFSGGGGEGTQLCTPGLVDFQNESGARGGGWLKKKKRESTTGNGA